MGARDTQVGASLSLCFLKLFQPPKHYRTQNRVLSAGSCPPCKIQSVTLGGESPIWCWALTPKSSEHVTRCVKSDSVPLPRNVTVNETMPFTCLMASVMQRLRKCGYYIIVICTRCQQTLCVKRQTDSKCVGLCRPPVPTQPPLSTTWTRRSPRQHVSELSGYILIIHEP